MGPEVVILGILGAIAKAVLPALARGAGAIVVGELIGKGIVKVGEAMTEEDDQEEA